MHDIFEESDVSYYVVASELASPVGLTVLPLTAPPHDDANDPVSAAEGTTTWYRRWTEAGGPTIRVRIRPPA